MMTQVQLCLFMVAAMGCFMMAPVSAFDHIVGGRMGWAIPPNATYFAEWAAKPRVFGVGDQLVFPFRSGHYNIIQVGDKDFAGCSMNAVITMIAKGPAIVTLDRTGDYYFYDGIGKHCELGQKLKVTVGNEVGTSGKGFSFDFIAPEAAPAPANNTTVPKASSNNTTVPKASSATSIRNVGLVSGSLVFLLSLFI